MNEHAMRDAYERALRARASSDAPIDLPLERLEALVAREGSEAERLRALDVALSSEQGRRELDVIWAAARATKSTTTRRLAPRMTALAATVVLSAGLGGWWLTSTSRPLGAPPSTRETLRGGDAPVRLLAPLGDVASSARTRFIWHRVAQARDYTLVVVDQAGHEVFALTTADTAVTLPDSVQLAPGAEYLWWVQAALSDGSTLSAVTEKIKIGPASR
jgi:hypothetical protein